MTEKAVKTYIWIAITVNVLIAILKKHLGMDLYNSKDFESDSFYNTPILQIRHFYAIQN